MSWGELTCEHMYNCNHNPTMIQCNKDCEHHKRKEVIEDEPCYMCREGVFVIKVDNCSYHISPPCSACTSAIPTCNKCGYNEESI